MTIGLKVVSPTALALTFAASIASACHPSTASHATDTTVTSLDASAKRRWIAKASRVLRYGKEVKSTEMNQLTSLPVAEVAERFMADPDFADAVLDFNLYFLGFQQSSLYTLDPDGRRVYNFNATSMQPALASAIQAHTGGDYFSIFSRRFPLYLATMNITMTKEVFNERIAQVINVEAVTDEEKKQRLCDAYAESGLTTVVAPALRREIGDVPSGGPISNECENVDTSAVTISEMISEYQRGMNKVYDSLIAPNGFNPRINSLLDFVSVKQHDAPPDRTRKYFSMDFWQRYPNSSTNFNRKRSATILKTFFCDDLTPLNVVAPDENHGAGAHASNPSCQACHYKLDPMAGLFRMTSKEGQPIKNGLLQFDDATSIAGTDLDAYLNTWRAPDPSIREWNVGYIRSSDPDYAELNTYGSSIEDLIDIIHDAPEVKRCLVKRMAEYFLGDAQVYDDGWIAHLDKTLTSSSTSGQGFKAVARELVLSNSFTEEDPAPGRCYDFAPGAEPSSLPCEVAFVIKKNCSSSCHKSVNSHGGLDLTSWTTGDDGKGKFKHMRAGEEVPRLESLTAMMARINSSDPEFAMPYFRHMDATQRAKLYQWLNEQVAD